MHHLEYTTLLPVTLAEAWSFFSSPLNLAKITPPDMGFKVMTGFEEGDQVRQGMLINYKVRPLFGIPVFWQSEITVVKPMVLFIDEQRRGPYHHWHHEHHFRETMRGVEMRDVVAYRLPFGLLGETVHRLLVKKKLLWIFEYRKKKLEELFPGKVNTDPVAAL